MADPLDRSALIMMDIVVYHKDQPINCKLCGELDHEVQECPTRNPRGPRCFACGEYGHVRRRCPLTAYNEDKTGQQRGYIQDREWHPADNSIQEVPEDTSESSDTSQPAEQVAEDTSQPTEQVAEDTSDTSQPTEQVAEDTSDTSQPTEQAGGDNDIKADSSGGKEATGTPEPEQQTDDQSETEGKHSLPPPRQERQANPPAGGTPTHTRMVTKDKKGGPKKLGVVQQNKLVSQYFTPNKPSSSKRKDVTPPLRAQTKGPRRSDSAKT
jgi:hypothetical protein